MQSRVQPRFSQGSKEAIEISLSVADRSVHNAQGDATAVLLIFWTQGNAVRFHKPHLRGKERCGTEVVDCKA